MRRWLAVPVLAMIAACARAQTGELRLAGSNVLARDLAPSLLTAFAAIEPSPPVSTDVTAGDTDAGLAALVAGRADIAMASRPASDDERVMALRAGLGDPAAEGNFGVVALDGVVIVVNRDNAIGILTVDQIRRLFSGQITNWSALGGRDLPVTLYGTDRTSGTFDTFSALAVGRDKMAASLVASESSKTVTEAVSADPGGVGFIGFDDAGAAKPVTIALACGLTIDPKPFNVRTEEYPLSRRMYFYTATSKPPLVRDFLHFALSDVAQPIAQRAGLTSLAPVLGVAGDGLPRPGIWEASETRHRRDILTHITQSLARASRLSPTFRFEPDGSAMDALALADIGRVAAWKRANPGRKLILVGYWSGPGSFDANLVLSAKRAQTVASALAAAGAAPDQVLAGSTLRPVACDDDTGGSSRRVEVWIR